MKAADLQKAAAREFALRRAVYPQQVMRGKMKQVQVDHELACAQAWIDLVALVPQLVEVLEAAAAALHPNAPDEARAATVDLADELLGKLRRIAEP